MRRNCRTRLLNLVINARDAMPRGGRLTIEISQTRLDADYAQMYPEVRTGRYVLIAVTDTGAGMSEEVRKRAFDPFFTTKPAGVGSGLGLSMVYGFVKQSGGNIQIYSELGRGTSVRIFLPFAEAEREENKQHDFRRAIDRSRRADRRRSWWWKTTLGCAGRGRAVEGSWVSGDRSRKRSGGPAKSFGSSRDCDDLHGRCDARGNGWRRNGGGRARGKARRQNIIHIRICGAGNRQAGHERWSLA